MKIFTIAELQQITDKQLAQLQEQLFVMLANPSLSEADHANIQHALTTIRTIRHRRQCRGLRL